MEGDSLWFWEESTSLRRTWPGLGQENEPWEYDTVLLVPKASRLLYYLHLLLVTITRSQKQEVKSR